MGEIVRQGKAQLFGASNYRDWQIAVYAMRPTVELPALLRLDRSVPQSYPTVLRFGLVPLTTADRR
jgi:aryl-alcohol dehydrogenase-like predicted oxidoreductase